MLFDPTERNVNPFLFQTRIRIMKKLMKKLICHHGRTGLALPLKSAVAPKLTETMSFRLSTLPKQRLIIAKPTNTRVPSPVNVQVRGSWHLCTPRWHQGRDSPPHTGKQWPTLLSSMRPDSWAPPVRMRARTRGTQGEPPTLCGTSPSLPSLPLQSV